MVESDLLVRDFEESLQEFLLCVYSLCVFPPYLFYILVEFYVN